VSAEAPGAASTTVCADAMSKSALLSDACPLLASAPVTGANGPASSGGLTGMARDGAIAGGVIGGVIVVALVLMAIASHGSAAGAAAAAAAAAAAKNAAISGATAPAAAVLA
jgi:hypothetical protein